MPNPYIRQRYGAVVDRPATGDVEGIVEHQSAGGPTHVSYYHETTEITTDTVENLHAVPLHSLMPGGPPLDSSDDELMDTDASIGYSNFPNAVHLMQTVFQPSRLLSRRVEELIEDDSPVAPLVAAVHPSEVNSRADYKRDDIEDLIEQTRAAMRAASAVVDEARRGEPQPSVHEIPHPLNAPQDISDRLPIADAVHMDAPPEAAPPTVTVQAESSPQVSILPTSVPDQQVQKAQETTTPNSVVGLNDSTLTIEQRPTNPGRIVLQPWSCEEADAAALCRLSRRPPPPLPLPLPEPAPLANHPPVVTQRKERSRRTSRGVAKHKPLATQPTPTPAPGGDMIPVTAVESLFKSVYAVIAQQQAARPTPSPIAPAVDPSSLLRNVYSNPPPMPHTATDPSVVIEGRPFNAPVAAIPSSRSSWRSEPPSVTPSVIAPSSAFPRVGVQAHSAELVARTSGVERSTHPPTQLSPTASRIRQPTESWKQRGLGPVHLKQAETTQRKPNTAASTVVNTAVSRHEQVSHLNHSAQRLLQRQTPRN